VRRDTNDPYKDYKSELSHRMRKYSLSNSYANHDDAESRPFRSCLLFVYCSPLGISVITYYSQELILKFILVHFVLYRSYNALQIRMQPIMGNLKMLNQDLLYALVAVTIQRFIQFQSILAMESRWVCTTGFIVSVAKNVVDQA
jgi:hypothetical protein